jgi:hypothetical protein
MSNPPAVPNIAIYTGGDPYSSTIATLFTEIQSASYTTAVLWAAHVDCAGNIAMNDNYIAAGGVFIQNAQPWADLVNGLRQGTVTRVELSLGGDQSTFANIQNLIQEYGIGTKNPLYNNLQVLQQVLSLDAIDYDDESQYDANSSEQLAQMCVNLGMKVTICPYTYESYWVNLVTSINAANPGTVDAVYLQCYDGGAGNDPVTWSQYFASTGLTITPGLWAVHGSSCESGSTAADVQSQMASWAQEAASNQTSLAGGFMFCGTDIQSCTAGGTEAEYANAIIQGLAGNS